METELRAAKRWSADLRGLGERLGRHFHRPEPQRKVQVYLQGLLSPLECKNGGSWPSRRAIAVRIGYRLLNHALGS